LSTDTVVACAVAKAIADRHNVLLLPPVTISCSHEHAGWAGTVSISHHTVAAIVHDVATSLRRSGIGRLVLVNGHGGNYVLSNVVQAANAERPRSMSLFPGRSDWDRARSEAGIESDAHSDMHAGELETSIMLHVWPEAVGADYQGADHVADDRPMLLVEGMRAYTANGVIGRPSLGTHEKGKSVLDILASLFDAHWSMPVPTDGGTPA
jgi:creatinine amidohydrolase